MKYANLFYLRHLCEIGGIEANFNYIAEQWNKYDITIVCVESDISQLRRLRRHVRVLLWDGKEEYECEKFFCCFNTEIRPYIKCDRSYLWVQGDYLDMINRGQLNQNQLPKWQDFDEIISISELVRSSWKQITGQDSTVIYNPIKLLKPAKKVIRICAAQRLSDEKGYGRIKELIKEADNFIKEHDEYDYILDLYTSSFRNGELTKENVSSHIGIHTPRFKIDRIFGHYDWFLVLSDNEGYCNSGVESLIRGTPLIKTPLKVLTEIGANETNSLTLKFDCSNVKQVVHDMFTKKLVFEYIPKKSTWEELLSKKPTYYVKEDKMVKVRALHRFFDKKENVSRAFNEIFEVDEARAKQMCETLFRNDDGTGMDGTMFCEYVKPSKDTFTEPTLETNVEETPKKKNGKRKTK